MPSASISSRFSLEAATRRKSTFISLVPPTRRIVLSSKVRKSFVCTSGLSVEISSRKSVPPSTDSIIPFLRLGAVPVKAFGSWPKSSLPMSSSGRAEMW